MRLFRDFKLKAEQLLVETAPLTNADLVNQVKSGCVGQT